MISKEHYNMLKSQDQKVLTNEEREWIREYESSEAGAPSTEDLEWAVSVMNTSDPYLIKAFRESGDTKRAEDIINQSRTAKELMIKQGKDPYVRPVSEVPDDVAEGYGFKFNWKDAYEKENGTPLRATEADAEKLRKYIDSKMYEVDDPVKLQQVAYNMHMWNPNTSSWSEFLQSEQGDRFREYLGDVQKYQKDKAVEKIFSGEDPTTVNYPIIGHTDIPFSGPAVDFMLPVSKEYAKNNYENINGAGDMAGPLALDAFANAFMTSYGKGAMAPKLSKVYENVGAPALTEIGQYAFNDKPLPQAAVGTLEGTLVNAGTPMAINRGGNWLERVFGGGKNTVNSVLNRAANKSREVAKKKKDGWIWLENGKVMKAGKDGVAKEVEPKASDLEKVIPTEDMKEAALGDRVKRFGQSEKSKITNKILSSKSSTNPELYRTELIKKLSNNQTPTLEEIQLARFRDKESLTNWLSSITPETFKDYATNLGGRAQFGQRGMGSLLNIYAPDLKLFKDKKDREKGTDKWYRYYGLK